MPAAADEAPVSAAESARLFADLSEIPTLVLAVSGGPDSTALLLLAARWSRTLPHRPRLLAVTIDHGLRAESADEAAAVARLAATLGVPHRTLQWAGPKPSTGIQNAARTARYRLLAAAAEDAGARHVLTAHTRDDQAETVLMRMARGSGLTGLAGMARVSPLGRTDLSLVRPFLDVPKTRLIATLAAAGVACADDPSNRNPRFTRPRLRGLLPTMAAEGLGADRLATLARRMARADAALEAAVDEALARVAVSPPSPLHVTFDADAVAALPHEVVLRLVGRAIVQTGDEGPVELAKLEALVEALGVASEAPRFRRTLAGALVTRDGRRIVVERAPARRTARKDEKPKLSGASAEGAIVKEIGPIPLADVPGGPTLALGRDRSFHVALTTVAAGPPVRRKGRQ